ncbi:MAG: glycoside hydrolase family 65 [Lachnospiraceae bacterium]|nr:glycoside hydrolase family 65 [Lachnospiraceae bacterium]
MNKKIDRFALVTRNNPKVTTMDVTSPFTVGNGEIAFTADVTGLQTCYEHYLKAHMPLCTQSQWGWHTTPVSRAKHSYSPNEVYKTEYRYINRKVFYPVERMEGNEEVYDWLRVNPHRQNLIRVALVEIPYRMEDVDKNHPYKEIAPGRISGIDQQLHMETGILDSRFLVDDHAFRVETACAGSEDAFAFGVAGKGITERKFAILLAFPYGSPDISASDWENAGAHTTDYDPATKTFCCYLDLDSYYVTLNGDVRVKQVAPHAFLLVPGYGQRPSALTFTLTFDYMVPVQNPGDYPTVMNKSVAFWKQFWEETGVIDFSQCSDERARELERRVVLSEYLMMVNSSGSMPPQETGLTCNSWYGKFHLEMHFWHEAWLPLFGRSDLLEKSLTWYKRRLPQARDNAAKNGFQGARWPKMVGPSGVDSPSVIAPLLIWQQPHIIYMLELAYRCHWAKADAPYAFLSDYYPLVKETADFMADYANKDHKGLYELNSPLIPVQECHKPEITKNPAFEVEYWVFGLQIAIEWAERLHKEIPAVWKDVAEQMIPAPISEGRYIAHSAAPDTFENFAKDHPSMLMTYGVIRTGRIDPEIMEATLDKVLECWDEKQLWGWDFAVMAMTAVLLGKRDLAIDLLLKDTCKNRYVVSGNNRQESRDDLPLYLPGNGSLLLAMALMCAGYDSSKETLPGFPDDGKWKVRFEGIEKLPY